MIVANNDKQRFQLAPINPEQGTVVSPSSDPGNFVIRASQGHSLAIDSSSLLTPVKPGDQDFPKEVVHGTNATAWKLILATGGLKRMQRTHIHFALDLPSSQDTKSRPGASTTSDENAQVEGKHAEMERISPELSEGPSAQAAIDVIDSVGDDTDKKVVQDVKAGTVISGMRASASILIWVDVGKSIEVSNLKWWRSANGVLLTDGDDEGMVKMDFVLKVVKRNDGQILWQPET